MKLAHSAQADSHKQEPQYNLHRFIPRTTLLDFIKKRLDPKIEKKLGKDPNRWYEELSIIHNIMTGERGDTIGRIVNYFAPPLGDKEFVKIGEGVFLYNGSNRELRGLWTSRNTTQLDYSNGGAPKEVPHVEWTVWRLGDKADLVIYPQYAGINSTDLLPENFEPKSERINVKGGTGDGKRPIRKFQTKNGNGEMTVFAKGAVCNLSFYYKDSKPRHRLTTLAGCCRITSEKEMEIALRLAKAGVHVPPIIGYYKAPFEEFLFMEMVQGTYPSQWLQSHKETIIEQDARMLATLCRLGYHKQRFADFDDKIFDGTRLYLIDTEEIVDLYDRAFDDFRGVLLDPTDVQKFEEFRKFQTMLFTQELKDVIYDYRESLLQSAESKILYAKVFCREIGIKELSAERMKALMIFGKSYTTHDDWFSAMSDTD